MKYIIACLGNPLMGDDGFGPAVARELIKRGHRNVVFNSDPLNLLTQLDDVDLVIIVDAVNLGVEPGSLFVAKLDDVREIAPRSSHSLPVTEILKIMRKILRKPMEVYIIGVQPARIEPGEDLTPPVQCAIKDAVLKIEELIVEKN
ncbi:MAG: hydrogenase maturation protease [Candidatus Nezhaarchaeota archaeon]|nr:hydrogenase maturation protease [Candidatus Nezhaarchaeota archaeon]MCX8141409.1 hydrogenase maturation protease [Candidatus Nezhaarchaeota archaeon]MDW8049675.1 hydrogenase maturation protease [Nitrososphaerota archaeon]